jgi:iron complex transport system substrate-binding protein
MARLGWPSLLGAAAVLATVLLVAGRAHPIRGALVGARGFGDGRIEGDAFPKRLTTPAGDVRLIPAPPDRIVSVYLASDEILAALVAPARLAAVSIFADDPGSSNCLGVYPPPRAAPWIARVRGEAEEILALRPDLVFVTNFTDDGTVRLLDGAGVPVVRFTDWASFDGVLADIRLTGAAVGAEAQAEALARAVEARLRAVDARVRGLPRVRALYYEIPGYTRGAGSLNDEMIQRAGGANVAREIGLQGIAPIGIESVLALAPEVIVIPGFDADGRVPEGLLSTPGWGQIPAVRAGRVHVVPAAWLTSVSQHAARGVEELARLFHPEAFPEAAPGRG